MLVIAHVKPGMRVMDLVPGHGYFTRLFAKAVGPKGYVYAYQPAEFDAFTKGKPAPMRAVAAEYPNVSVIDAPVNGLTAPEPLDLVWTSQNYHDLHDSFAKPADLALVNKAVFNALKRGGLYIVLDHAAEKGSGLRDTETLHRIDEATVKSEVAGGRFQTRRREQRAAQPGRCAHVESVRSRDPPQDGSVHSDLPQTLKGTRVHAHCRSRALVSASRC